MRNNSAQDLGGAMNEWTEAKAALEQAETAYQEARRAETRATSALSDARRKEQAAWDKLETLRKNTPGMPRQPKEPGCPT